MFAAGRHDIRADARPGGRDHWLRQRGAAPARTRIGTAPVTRASQILSQAGHPACRIGRATRETFYRRAAYQPWRRYAMFYPA